LPRRRGRALHPARRLGRRASRDGLHRRDLPRPERGDGARRAPAARGHRALSSESGGTPSVRIEPSGAAAHRREERRLDSERPARQGARIEDETMNADEAVSTNELKWVSEADVRQGLEKIRQKPIDPQRGLFGPGSMYWEVNKHTVVYFLGAVQAVQMQLVHP